MELEPWISQEPIVGLIPYEVDLHEYNSKKNETTVDVLWVYLGDHALKKNLFEFEWGQNNNFILGLFKIFNLANSCR